MPRTGQLANQSNRQSNSGQPKINEHFWAQVSISGAIYAPRHDYQIEGQLSLTIFANAHFERVYSRIAHSLTTEHILVGKTPMFWLEIMSKMAALTVMPPSTGGSVCQSEGSADSYFSAPLPLQP